MVGQLIQNYRSNRMFVRLKDLQWQTCKMRMASTFCSLLLWRACLVPPCSFRCYAPTCSFEKMFHSFLWPLHTGPNIQCRDLQYSPQLLHRISTIQCRDVCRKPLVGKYNFFLLCSFPIGWLMLSLVLLTLVVSTTAHNEAHLQLEMEVIQ